VSAFRRSVPTRTRTAIVKAEVNAIWRPSRRSGSGEQFWEFACLARELSGDGSREPTEREVLEVFVGAGSQAQGVVQEFHNAAVRSILPRKREVPA